VSGRNSRGVRKESGCQGVTGRGSLGVRGCEEEMSGSPQEEARALQGRQPERQEVKGRTSGSLQEASGRLQGKPGDVREGRKDVRKSAGGVRETSGQSRDVRK